MIFHLYALLAFPDLVSGSQFELPDAKSLSKAEQKDFISARKLAKTYLNSLSNPSIGAENREAIARNFAKFRDEFLMKDNFIGHLAFETELLAERPDARQNTFINEAYVGFCLRRNINFGRTAIARLLFSEKLDKRLKAEILCEIWMGNYGLYWMPELQMASLLSDFLKDSATVMDYSVMSLKSPGPHDVDSMASDDDFIGEETTEKLLRCDVAYELLPYKSMGIDAPRLLGRKLAREEKDLKIKAAADKLNSYTEKAQQRLALLAKLKDYQSTKLSPFQIADLFQSWKNFYCTPDKPYLRDIQTLISLILDETYYNEQSFPGDKALRENFISEAVKTMTSYFDSAKIQIDCAEMNGKKFEDMKMRIDKILVKMNEKYGVFPLDLEIARFAEWLQNYPHPELPGGKK